MGWGWGYYERGEEESTRREERKAGRGKRGKRKGEKGSVCVIGAYYLLPCTLVILEELSFWQKAILYLYANLQAICFDANVK